MFIEIIYYPARFASIWLNISEVDGSIFDDFSNGIIGIWIFWFQFAAIGAGSDDARIDSGDSRRIADWQRRWIQHRHPPVWTPSRLIQPAQIILTPIYKYVYLVTISHTNRTLTKAPHVICSTLTAFWSVEPNKQEKTKHKKVKGQSIRFASINIRDHILHSNLGN